MPSQDDSSRTFVSGRRWVWLAMELQQNLELIFDVDAVLRGQGAAAAVLRARRPALEGAGAAAVEALANAACLYFEKQAAEDGLQASIPFSPGMMDWSVSDGQPQIFQLLGEAGSIVNLTPSYLMIPRKSLTMVMGIGADLKSSGRTCDYCTMRGTCRYQDHYAT